MKWSKRNIFVYRNVIVHGDVNPMFDREKIHQGMQLPLFPVREVGATKIWVFPPSFKDLSILELLETAAQIAPLKRSNEKMPTRHMFASKKYLDLDLEQFWTIAGSGWCLSNRLNIDGSHHFEGHEMCPWYSPNEVTTMAPPLKWPDSQHERMHKKPVPSPLARLSLSQVTALAFAKLSSGRLESFSPVQQRYAKVT